MIPQSYARSGLIPILSFLTVYPYGKLSEFHDLLCLLLASDISEKHLHQVLIMQVRHKTVISMRNNILELNMMSSFSMPVSVRRPNTNQQKHFYVAKIKT